MISQTTLLILGGCLLGAIQLVTGIAIGFWVRRSNVPESDHGQHHLRHASEVAAQLKALAGQMSSSANEHRSQLDQASQLLTSDDARTNEALAELVVDVIGGIVRANQNLQSQLETAEHRLEEQAVEIEAHMSRSLTDQLTNLPNRRAFNARLEERMSAWKRRGEVFSLLLVDVDHFKALNDEHGHPAGDQVLAAIGRTLRGAVRREDAVARYGGEEFAILLPNAALDQATTLAEAVRLAVLRLVTEYNHHQLKMTVSGGLAVIEKDDTAETLIQRADAALYAAKASGRNRTCAYDGDEAVLAAGPASRLVELIHTADGENRGTSLQPVNTPVDFGSFLERDVISPELAEACNELRRVVEERAQYAPIAARS